MNESANTAPGEGASSSLTATGRSGVPPEEPWTLLTSLTGPGEFALPEVSDNGDNGSAPRNSDCSVPGPAGGSRTVSRLKDGRSRLNLTRFGLMDRILGKRLMKVETGTVLPAAIQRSLPTSRREPLPLHVHPGARKTRPPAAGDSTAAYAMNVCLLEASSQKPTTCFRLGPCGSKTLRCTPLQNAGAARVAAVAGYLKGGHVNQAGLGSQKQLRRIPPFVVDGPVPRQ